MNRKLTGLAAAVVLALVGTLVLVGYVRSAEARALAGEELVPVLVVRELIEAGTPAEEIADLVTTEEVPAKVRAAGAVTDLDELEGTVATVDLLPGEQVVTERFDETIVREAGVSVPSGLLEVTVSLEPQRALGGNLHVGDRVGVLASFDGVDASQGPVTHLALHKVLVTNVQYADAPEEVDDDEAEIAPSGQLLVTLALDAPSIEKVVFAAEHGTIWLSNEPADAAEAGTSVVTKGSIFS